MIRINKNQEIMINLAINNWLAKHHYVITCNAFISESDKLNILCAIALDSDKLTDDFIRRALTRTQEIEEELSRALHG